MKTKHQFIIISLLIVAVYSIGFAQDNTQVGLPEGAIARLGKGGINIMRFSPDGTHLAVGTDVGVWLYDLPDGKETALFTEHSGQVNALAYSHDGKILACAGFLNPVIQLWDMQTHSKHSTFTLNNRTNAISELAFTDDNKTLVSLVMLGGIILWDVKTGKNTFHDIVGSIHLNKTAAISQNGKIFAIGEENGKIFAIGEENGKINLWDVKKRKKSATLKGHSSLFKGDNLPAAAVSKIFNQPQYAEIRELAFSSDGLMLVSGSSDHTIQIWDIKKRKRLATFKGHEDAITSVAFSTDGKLVASGDDNKVIRLWDVDGRDELATFTGHKNKINALVFSPNRETLVSGSADGTIRLWNTINGEAIATLASGYTEAIKSIAFSENGTTHTTAASNGTVDVWSLNTLQELTTYTFGENNITTAATLSPDATHFAYQDKSRKGNNSIQVCEIISNKKIPGPWQDIKTREVALIFSPDNKTIVINSQQGIHSWDINTRLELFHYKMEHRIVSNMVFSSNGRLFASYGTRVRTRIWDITKDRQIAPSHMKNATALAFSSDGSLLAHKYFKDGIVLWDVTPLGLRERGKIPDSKSGFGDVLVFSPDRTTLFDVKQERWQDIIQLWDVDTGTDLGTLSGHTEKITMLVFSHDGKTLASCSEDGTVILWKWHKIVSKRASDNKEIRNKLIPPQQRIQYAGKAEEAEAVMKWLQNNGYQIKRSGDGYNLIHGNSKSHVSGNSSISLGDISFSLDRNGVLRIRVGGVGAGSYILNEKGNLKIVMEDTE